MNQTKKKMEPGIGVQRKENESLGSLSRRFSQKVRQSGTLYEARQRRFLQREPNRRARRKSALVRAQRRKEYEKKRKWGKTR